MSAGRSAPGVRVTLLPHEKATQGEPWTLSDRLVSFEFEDCESKADKVTLTLDNFDLALFDRAELMGGGVLEVAWGYAGNLSTPRRVVIKSLKGFTTLTVEGQALSAAMHQHAKTRRWMNRTRADVVREIAREQGYEAEFVDVEETGHVYDVIHQTAETDARFLRRLAAREGFAFFVDASGLHWHRRRQNGPPSRVFTWYSDSRGEVLSIQVESNLAKRAGKVAVKGRDPLQKVTHESTANADTAKRDTLADVVEVIDPVAGTTSFLHRNATSNVAPSSATSEATGKREAEARFVAAEREALKVTMQVVGDPTLSAKSVVELRGVATVLAGKYYVTEVKHSIATSGYTCDLKLTRDGQGRPVGPTAAERTKPQTGDKNASSPNKPGEPRQVETFDPETGAVRIVYRSDGTGSGDPEATQGR